jgi:hypothetical protein
VFVGPESAIHNLMRKDYPAMQKEKDILRRKQVGDLPHLAGKTLTIICMKYDNKNSGEKEQGVSPHIEGEM